MALGGEFEGADHVLGAEASGGRTRDSFLLDELPCRSGNARPQTAHVWSLHSPVNARAN